MKCFEGMYPFIDENGRTKRLILNLKLLNQDYYQSILSLLTKENIILVLMIIMEQIIQVIG